MNPFAQQITRAANLEGVCEPVGSRDIIAFFFLPRLLWICIVLVCTDTIHTSLLTGGVAGSNGGSEAPNS